MSAINATIGAADQFLPSIDTDLVYKRLLQTSGKSPHSQQHEPVDPQSWEHEQDAGSDIRTFEWLDFQSQRRRMRQQATTCAWSAWLLMTFTAILSSIVAYLFLTNIQELFLMQRGYMEAKPIPQTAFAAPIGLGIIAFSLLFGGGLAIAFQRFPGQSSTNSACDAMAKLLSHHCTYSDSLRTASQIMPIAMIPRKWGFSNRVARWMSAAADRVDQGGQIFPDNLAMSADEATLHLLVDSDSHDPAKQWRVAAEHFSTVADKRLSMLTQCLPPIATILSGIMLWISISATLGWMWRSIASMLNSFGAGL